MGSTSKVLNDLLCDSYGAKNARVSGEAEGLFRSLAALCWGVKSHWFGASLKMERILRTLGK